MSQHSHKNSSVSLKNFLQTGVVTIGDILHAQQSSDIREGHQCWLCCVPAADISFLHKLRWYVLYRGVKTRGRGAQIPGRQFATGALNHCGGAKFLRKPPKSPNNVTSTFFNTANFLSKELRFHHGGAGSTTGAPNLFFAPGAI